MFNPQPFNYFMNINAKNYLSTYRKKNTLQLSDIGFLLNNDIGNLSSYERGKLKPTLKTIVGYHILFNIPIHTLIKQEYVELSEIIKDRCFQLIEKIEFQKKSVKNEMRIKTLNKIVTRIIPLDIFDDE